MDTFKRICLPISSIISFASLYSSIASQRSSWPKGWEKLWGRRPQVALTKKVKKLRGRPDQEIARSSWPTIIIMTLLKGILFCKLAQELSTHMQLPNAYPTGHFWRFHSFQCHKSNIYCYKSHLKVLIQNWCNDHMTWSVITSLGFPCYLRILKCQYVRRRALPCSSWRGRNIPCCECWHFSGSPSCCRFCLIFHWYFASC